ncbi:hypothetical protein KR009_011927 [Drosophila setifemur]|nr:hypothetical protein KR009_011927 [Drosophila setifemur]
MAVISFISALFGGFLFMSSLAGVSEAVKIIWTTGSAAYAVSSLLLIIGVWKKIRGLVIPYMCLLLMAIAVYTMVLDEIIGHLALSVFMAVAISFIFLGIALYMIKSFAK